MLSQSNIIKETNVLEGSYMIYFITILLSFLGGLVQSITGFGAGIVIMSVLPFFLSVAQSAAVSNVITIILVISMFWQYRKYTNWKLVLWPAVYFIIGVAIALAIVFAVNVQLMKMIFSIFLIFLAIYFAFFGSKVKISPNFWTMFLCSFFSGLGAGLFAIGGPLMVLYYLEVTKTRQEYLGTLQAQFLVTNLLSIIMRSSSNLLTMDLIPISLLGMAAITVGLIYGNRISDHLDSELIKKMIYVVIGACGVINLVMPLV